MKSLNDFDERFLLAGKVIGVHGIQGAVKFKSFVDEKLLTPDNPLFYRSRDRNFHRISILSIKPYKRNFLITLEGISDRTQATTLVGIDIFIQRNVLPDLDSDTFYWFEIQGLEVIDTSGHHCGVIRSIIETGSNDVYVIEKNGEEYLIPAIESAVINIDIQKKQMVIDHEQMIDY
ncbi:MAG: 16S rRNA processing protein RimM [Candidatus Magnetoglobus multicellularis str. Araruama]|uniref:Ribosome maturation factor RimM n=1 Tax=Candidatus Magnetoglobus multicellularis str. Araruama TaxID=890399 RepID=A0A1V1PH71_9BACT|nr:MAG: 16S rRNA processing protein RimM [Candidatus Magnetoglobus multicellularis str. Araruama]